MRMHPSIIGYCVAVAGVTLAILILLPPAAFAQVNLPEGFEVVQFEFTPLATFGPEINDCGEIVWSRGQEPQTNGIYYYDNGRVNRLSGENVGLGVGTPDINAAGLIVWSRRIAQDVAEILIYRDGRETVIGPGVGGALNNLEQIACMLFREYTCQPDFDILFYNGRRARLIEKSRQVDQSTDINDAAQIVYMHTNFCVQPWAGDIRLYVNGVTQVLPSAYTQVQEPHINHLGHVVWVGSHRVELWNGQNTIEIGLVEASVPNLNDVGDVYFAWWDPSRDTWQPMLIKRREGDRLYRLAGNDLSYGRASLNDWGEVTGVYYDYDRYPSGGIWYLRRIRTGDSEFNGDIDLDDYAAFAACMSGPVWVDRLCDCRFLDLDHDGDVDLRDFASFQSAFGGVP